MKKRGNEHPVDYWDSLADAMLALFLCVLLIVLLLLLYFVRDDRENEQVDNQLGFADSWDVPRETDDGHHYDDPKPGDTMEVPEQQSSGGQGGGETPRPTDTPRPTARPTDQGEKSAVLVEVVDGETRKLIAREDIEFELYDEHGRVQTLHDYYPQRVEQTIFETTEFGTFYLPEKIYQGFYTLSSRTRVEGYGPIDDTVFYLDDYYDWEDPYVVTVEIFPLRSVIRLRLVDRDTGEGLAGGSFRVIAAENVVTLDGTVRYHAGEVVDTVVTDVNGNGESKELYFGTYLLRQLAVPEYYGRIDSEPQVELMEKTSGSDEPAALLQAEKTSLCLNVRDALYDDLPVAGAEFTLIGGTTPAQTLVTDRAGQIYLTNLQKNTSYVLRQTGASSDYIMDTADHAFTVDSGGWIQGLVHQDMYVENRMIRAKFYVTGTLMGDRMSDIRMVLSDPNGTILHQWTTSGEDVTITGLEPGTYRLILGSDRDNPVEVYIADVASVQVFHYTTWTMTDTALAAGAGFAVLGTLVLILFAIRRRKKRTRRGTDKA